jgi:hypothetical protein
MTHAVANSTPHRVPRHASEKSDAGRVVATAARADAEDRLARDAGAPRAFAFRRLRADPSRRPARGRFAAGVTCALSWMSNASVHMRFDRQSIFFRFRRQTFAALYFRSRRFNRA